MKLKNEFIKNLRKILLMVEEGDIPVNKVPYHKWIAEKISREPYAQYTRVIHKPQVVEKWWQPNYYLKVQGEIVSREKDKYLGGEIIKIKLVKEGDFIVCSKKRMIVLIDKTTYKKYRNEYEKQYLLSLDEEGEAWIAKIKKEIGEIASLDKEIDLFDPEEYDYSDRTKRIYKTKNGRKLGITVNHQWYNGCGDRDTYVIITIGKKIFRAHSRLRYIYNRDYGLEDSLEINYEEEVKNGFHSKDR